MTQYTCLINKQLLSHESARKLAVRSKGGSPTSHNGSALELAICCCTYTAVSFIYVCI